MTVVTSRDIASGKYAGDGGLKAGLAGFGVNGIAKAVELQTKGIGEAGHLAGSEYHGIALQNLGGIGNLILHQVAVLVEVEALHLVDAQTGDLLLGALNGLVGVTVIEFDALFLGFLDLLLVSQHLLALLQAHDVDLAAHAAQGTGAVDRDVAAANDADLLAQIQLHLVAGNGQLQAVVLQQ